MPHQIRGKAAEFIRWLPILLLTACASAPDPGPAFKPPIYPAPPDEARFIFEQTLRYSTNVQVPDKLSKLRLFATGERPEIKGLVKPFGVVAHKGRVYVSDTVQRRIILFDIAGKRYLEFGLEAPGELQKPIGLDISSRDELFVADISARRIVVFDLDGNFKRFIGDPSLLKRPGGVSISPDGQKLYVIDTGGVDNDAHHLYIFDAQSGELLATIGQRGTEPGNFNLPLQVATAADGTVYVVDKGNFRVQAFDEQGRYLRSFGTVGRLPGQFFSPKGIATDAAGNVYVVDTAFGNVQIFNAQGQLLMVIGQRGQSSAPGNYMLPAGVDVDEQGKVYITDQFFRKVDIFRPVGLKEPASSPP